MGSWNHRLVRKAGSRGGSPVEWFDLHEVHYDRKGEVTAMSAGPVTFGGDNPQDVIGSLGRALDDARSRLVFDPPAGWPKPQEQDDVSSQGPPS